MGGLDAPTINVHTIRTVPRMHTTNTTHARLRVEHVALSEQPNSGKSAAQALLQEELASKEEAWLRRRSGPCNTLSPVRPNRREYNDKGNEIGFAEISGPLPCPPPLPPFPPPRTPDPS